MYRRDVLNVRDQFNIGCIQKHADDHTSVDVWIQELRQLNDANPVLLYKRQGDQLDCTSLGLAATDFVLCIQTVTQRQFMLQFGNGSVVCLDSTHGTNQYGFNLVTMMVVDDFGQGNPVAFMIATKEDETVLSAFFRSIKSRLTPELTFAANEIMTDDAAQYYNAWVSVFGPAEKRLCVWHVDRAWRRAIKDNIADAEVQAEIYHMLRSVMQELDEESFKQCLQSLADYLQEVAPRFALYFDAYCMRAEEWAYCYRKGTAANTNMYLESFHNVLKTAYMERKANRRVDTLLHTLLKVARDKAFERLIKVEKKTHSRKLQDIDKRHVVLLSELPQLTDGGWFVASQTSAGQMYFVIPASQSCNCLLHCSTCKCCPHMYECSCIDFAVHATVCKHVHTIHHLRQINASGDFMEVEGETSVSASPSQIEPEIVNNDAEVQPTDNVVSSVTAKKTCKELCILQCRQLLAAVTAGNFSDEAFAAATKHAKAAMATLDVSSAAKPGRLHVRNKLPANKKLVTQFRFRSIRQKRQPTRVALRKPNAVKVAAVKQTLLHRRQNGGTSLDVDVENRLDGKLCADLAYIVDTEDVYSEPTPANPSVNALNRVGL